MSWLAQLLLLSSISTGQMHKPSFPQAFAEALSFAAQKRGWRAYIPVRLLLCSLVGLAISFNLPATLWDEKNISNALNIYTGLLAFNGLLLAIGWGAYSRLYELIGSGAFSKFLKRNNLLNHHIFFIELSQITLVLSSLASGFGLFSVLLPFNVVVSRVIIGASVALTAYAILKAVEATQAMNQVLWEAADFEEAEVR